MCFSSLEEGFMVKWIKDWACWTQWQEADLEEESAVKHGGGSIVLCCVLLPVHKVDGIFKEDYLQILQLHLKSTARGLKLWHSWVFQQDNDTKHIKTGSECIKQSNIEHLDWPPQSPDLNPIKNFWFILKSWIWATKPTNLINFVSKKCGQISSQIYARSLLMATKRVWLSCNLLRDI